MDDNILANPGLMDPSTEFGNMMQTAMKIKGHQMEQDRRKFETWPQFFQNSLWMKGPPLELRPLPPAERLSGATALKEKGNELFKAKKFGLAVEQYESALGCFKWAKQLDADWKSKGIRDETIEVCEEFGEGETREAVVALMVSCYNNLAARHSPEDKAVRSMLAKLRKTRAEQREKDTATYSGLFGRGEIYDAKSLRAQKEREAKEVGKAKATEKARTPEDCEREAKEAEAVVEHLREQGKLDEAAQLSSKIAEHRKQLDEYRQLEESGQGSGRPDHIDFRNPTDEQLRDAQKHGIDLRDPMVVAELERLQNEKVAEDGEVGDAVDRRRPTCTACRCGRSSGGSTRWRSTTTTSRATGPRSRTG